jgi:hypothetical protein
MQFPTVARSVAGVADGSGTCRRAGQAEREASAAAPRNLRAGGPVEVEPLPPRRPP